MIDTKALPERILHDIARNRGWDTMPKDERDASIAAMSVHDALSAYFTWHGLIGWTDTILTTVDAVRGAERAS